MTSTGFSLLVASLESGDDVKIVVDACAYTCCGRGWQERAGYEQTYQGRIANIVLPDDTVPGGARLVATGAGTISYFVVFGLDHVVDVEAV